MMEQHTLQRTGWERYLPLFVLALFVAQPLLDVLSYWVQDIHWDSAPMLLRLVVLFAAAIVGFACSERRRVYGGLFAAAAALGAGHVIACNAAGYAAQAEDIAHYLYVVQIPLLALCLISMLKKNKACYRSIELGYTICFAIILAVELLSTLTGTDPHTYTNKGIGVLGWFNYPNSQSAVLCALVPIVLMLAMRRKKPLLLAAAVVLTYGVLFLFATRLAYFGIFACAVGITLVMLLARCMDRRAAALLLAGAVVCGAGYSVSPMHQNRLAQQAVAQQAQEQADATIAQLEAQYGVTAEQAPERILVPVYEEYVGEFMDRFGEQRVLEAYDYTTDVTELKDWRRLKRMYNQFLQAEAGSLAVLFGMEYADMTYEGFSFNAENGFHDIFYLYGAFGLALLLAFLLYFAYITIRALRTDFHRYMTLEAGAFGISLCLLLAHCVFTSGVLEQTTVSIYLSAALAAVYYFFRLAEAPKAKAYPPKAQEHQKKKKKRKGFTT